MLEEVPSQDAVEEVKESIVLEQKKVVYAPQVRKPEPEKPLIALKLKLPGMGRQEKGFIKNIFEEALNEHYQIPIANCDWAYKVQPMTISGNESASGAKVD